VRVIIRLVITGLVSLPLAAKAEPQVTTSNFIVTRDGAPIGTCEVRLQHNGAETSADTTTHIAVKFAGITVYRFDQIEKERWRDGRLQQMTSRTDDDGTVHSVVAARRDDGISVTADGKTLKLDATVIPASVWNEALTQRTTALNPNDGTLMRFSVVSHGEGSLLVAGRRETARHYSIKGGFTQDVWYAADGRLVKVQLRGSDGSTIQYLPG
jgi:hypothetical protein